MKSHNSQQYASGSTKCKSGAMKPPIAPKPNFKVNADHQRHYHDTTDDSGRLMSNVNSTLSQTSSQIYSYPTSVLIKDEDMFDEFDTQNSFAKLMPLPLSVPSGFPDSNSSLSQKGLLPPLTKAEIKPSYNNQSSEYLASTRTGGRTMSASAKNALMIEKIRGNISYQDEYIQDSDLFHHDGSNTTKESYKNNCVSINKSLDFFNDSLPETFHEKARTKYQPISLDNSVLQPTNHDTSNKLYLRNSAPKSIDKSFCAASTCTCLGNVQCKHRIENHNGTDQHNMKNISKEKLKYTPSISKDKYSTEYTNGEISPQILDSSTDDVNSSYTKCKYSLGTSSIYISSSQSAPCSPATKPYLKKSDAIDIEDYEYYKRLSRGISRATDNINIVSKARSEIAQEIWEALESTAAANNTPFFLETPVITFTLPDLSCYTDEFRSFLEKDLIEMSTLVSLEAAGRLNWWAMIGASQRLWPLATTGDGNCLLHAASLGMWGFHDRLLTLRKALHDYLTRSQYSLPLWRRWRWQVAMQNRETDLVYNQEEWDAEWESVLRLASSAPRIGSHQQTSESTTNSAPDLTLNQSSLSQGGPIYESLEEIHVLALAHVLKRPIIVVADITLKDMNGDPLAPIPFGGIYLPLQCPPKDCKRSPLLLTYDAAHFSSLVAMEINDKDTKASLPAVIPVSDCSHDLLPIQFLIDPGDDFPWGKDEFDSKVIQKLTLTTHDKKGLLNEYLDLVQVPIPSNYLEAASSYGHEGGDSPESVASDPFELDKKSSESSFDSDDSPPPIFEGSGTLPSRVRAPRQLQTVVKSFGSMSRSMSKKIKKNLSKLSRTGSFRKKNNFNKGFKKGSRKVRVATHQNFILAANIHIDQRQPYQVKMIDNYLSAAKERFFRDATPISSSAQKVSDSSGKLEEVQSHDFIDGYNTGTSLASSEAMQCINAGCNLYGTSKTSYMCSSCFNRQKEQEEKEYERQLSGEISSTTTTPLPSDRDLRSSPSSSVTASEQEFDHSPVMSMMCNTGAQYGAGKSKFYTSLDEHSVRNATLIPTTQSFSAVKDKTIFLSNSTFYKDLPSYNLNKSLQREQSRSDMTKAKASLDCLSNKSSPANLNDSLTINRLHQEKSSLKAPIRDSLAPICIDKLRVQLGGNCSPHKTKTSLRASLNGRGGGDGFFPEDISSQNCLTKGCPFYGNASNDSLCSKCHNAKRKNTDSYSLDQIKFVQI